MEKLIEELAGRYDEARDEGQRFVSKYWRALQPSTQATLTESGFYTFQGRRLDKDFAVSNLPQHDVERLEYALGLFVRCKDAQLPPRDKSGGSIPVEALSSDLLSSAGDLLHVRAWSDPFFLRLALGAVATHLKATALTSVGPSQRSSPALSAIGGIVKGVLIFAMPASLAMALLAVARQDVGESILWLYAVGWGVLCAMSALKVGLPKPEPAELSYNGWARFHYDHAIGVTGTGALEYLRRMSAEGIRVPTLMFDLADTIRQRMAEDDCDSKTCSVKALQREAHNPS